MATMRDVAQRAGVSAKTVSNVLSGYPYIKEATRAKVLSAIDELGYQMNISARNLRAGRTGIIALAVPELSLPYFAQLSDAVIETAATKGWTVVVEQTGGVRERELDVLSGARRHLVDGLIFSPLALGPDDAGHLRVDFPLVLLGERILHGPADHVSMSNVQAARGHPTPARPRTAAHRRHRRQRGGRRSNHPVRRLPGRARSRRPRAGRHADRLPRTVVAPRRGRTSDAEAARRRHPA